MYILQSKIIKNMIKLRNSTGKIMQFQKIIYTLT